MTSVSPADPHQCNEFHRVQLQWLYIYISRGEREVKCVSPVDGADPARCRKQKNSAEVVFK